MLGKYRAGFCSEGNRQHDTDCYLLWGAITGDTNLMRQSREICLINSD